MKKIIRLTENDLRRIINRIVEQSSAVDLAKTTIMRGVFGKKSDPNQEQPSSTATKQNPSSKSVKIYKNGESIPENSISGITNGEWTTNRLNPKQIQLWYKKSRSVKSTALVVAEKPVSMSKNGGRWLIRNNKLIIN
jgi:hypothetical protein